MELEIKEYILPLKKWWWLIILTMIVAAVASFLATRQQVPIYRSTTRLMIGNSLDDPTLSSNDLNTPRQLAPIYVDLAQGPGVYADAAEALGLTVLPDYIISQVNDTNFIEVTVTDTDAERAQLVAKEFARQITLRSPSGQDDENEFIYQLIADLEVQIQDTQVQIDAKEIELGELASAREISQANDELVTLESNLSNLTNRYTEFLTLTKEGATNAIRIIEEANLPSEPINPSSIISIVTAAGIGLVLSVSAAYLLEYLDDSIKTPDQIMRMTNLPTLAGIAFIDTKDEKKLVAIDNPRSPTAEAFRVLRTAVQFSIVEKVNQIMLVTSAVPGDGKSTTASNLAVVLAQAGNNVALVEGDLRRPSQHDLFNLSNKRGVTSLLLQLEINDADERITHMVEDTIQSTRVEGLQVLTCGPIPPNPSELLGSAKMRRLLNVLNRNFDFVILDSSPVLSVTDATVLSALAGNTLIVVRANKSRKDQLKQVVERLNDVNATVAGVILNSIKPRSEAFDSYYYYKNPYYSLDDKEVEEAAGSSVSPEKLRKRLISGKEAVQSR